MTTSIYPANTNGSANLLKNCLTREQLAPILNKSVRTLDRMHAKRIGPPRIKVGKLILYRAEAVEDWLKLHEQQPTALKPRR